MSGFAGKVEAINSGGGGQNNNNNNNQQVQQQQQSGNKINPDLTAVWAALAHQHSNQSMDRLPAMSHPKPSNVPSPFPQLLAMQQQQQQQQQLNFLASRAMNAPESHHHPHSVTAQSGPKAPAVPPLVLNAQIQHQQQQKMVNKSEPPLALTTSSAATNRMPSAASTGPPQDATAQMMAASQRKNLPEILMTTQQQHLNNNNNSAQISAGTTITQSSVQTTTVKLTYQNHHQKDAPQGALQPATSSTQPVVIEEQKTTTSSSLQITVKSGETVAPIAAPAVPAAPQTTPPKAQSVPQKPQATPPVAVTPESAIKEKKAPSPATAPLHATPTKAATPQKLAATKHTVTTPSKTTMKLATVTTPRIKQTARKNQNPLQQQRSPTNLASISTPSANSTNSAAKTQTPSPKVTTTTPSTNAPVAKPESVKLDTTEKEKPAAAPSVSRKRASDVEKKETTRTDSVATPKTKRNRVQTIPYQSPLPELALFQRMSVNAESPVHKRDVSNGANSEAEKLILFYKNEFVAVRNSEDGFFLCQILQNVYKSSPKIRIRWLSETKAKSQIYVPDFYDQTDLECILTSVSLDKDKQQFKLPTEELVRIENILKKAMGLLSVSEITEDNPDGLDLSIYKDESQLDRKEKKRKSEVVASAPKTPQSAAQTAAKPTPKGRATNKKSVGNGSAKIEFVDTTSPRVSKRGRAIQGATPNYREEEEIDETSFKKKEIPVKKVKKDVPVTAMPKEQPPVASPSVGRKGAPAKRKAEIISEMKKTIETTNTKEAAAASSVTPPSAKKTKVEKVVVSGGKKAAGSPSVKTSPAMASKAAAASATKTKAVAEQAAENTSTKKVVAPTAAATTTTTSPKGTPVKKAAAQTPPASTTGNKKATPAARTTRSKK